MIPEAARLLLPADADVPAALRHEDDPAAETAAVVVRCWEPVALGSARATVARAARREVSLVTRPGGPGGRLRPVAVHRIDPPRARPGGLRQRARRAALGGMLVEWSSVGRYRRTLDAVVEDAGCPATGAVLTVGSGGAALVRAEHPSGTAVIRAGREGGTSDPAHAAVGLGLLAGHRLPGVPRLLGADRTGDVSWTAEEKLPGRRPDEVTDGILHAALELLEALPRTGGEPTSVVDDIRSIAAAVPAHGPALERLAADVGARLGALPSVMRHGDLWSGNLLVAGTTVGFIDWDAWHPRAVPGTDVLQLLVTEERHRRRLSIGEAWRAAPWHEGDVANRLHAHLQRLGVAYDEELGGVVGVGWWAGEVAGTLSRTPALGTDAAWLERNVAPVVS